MLNPSFGINLGVVAPWSSHQPFLDYFKQSEWYSFNQQDQWFTRRNDAILDLDNLGWLRSLPVINGQVQPVMAAVLWNRWHPPGRYVITYKGKGQLSTDFEPIESKPGRLVIELGDAQRQSEQLQIYIDATDPQKTGDYIRDIRVYRLEDEPLVQAGEIYRPEFLDKVSDFRTFRYMDWLTTNFSEVKAWNPAQQKISKAQYTPQVPYEAIAALANQTKTDVWINIPHQATDQFIRNAARYLKQNVDPSLRIYVEYSNEHFTEGFDQYRYFIEQGKQRWGDSVANPGGQFYGARAAEMSQIFGQVFGDQKQSRLFPVLTFRASDRNANVNAVLEAPAAVREGHIAPKDAGFRAYAVDTYFGFEFGNEGNFSTLRRWMKEPDRGVAKVVQAIQTGQGLPISYGSLQEFEAGYQFHRRIADRLGWQFTSYEGGSGISAQNFVDRNGDGQNDIQDIVDYLIFLNRHPAIRDVYRSLYQGWRESGGELALHYADIGFPDWYGSWGLYESVYAQPQERSPRGDLVYSLNQQLPDRWSDRRSASVFANGRLVRGTQGGDRLGGTPQADRLFGLQGRDMLLGNSGHDLLVGGSGGDQLTGGRGRDTFRLTAFQDSTLRNRDHITDFQVGVDRLQGPSSIPKHQIQNIGRVRSLSALDDVLSAHRFRARTGATFQVGDRTFLAINNSRDGFQMYQDTVLELTGYQGNLNQLSVNPLG